ncbi:TetR/AcrR family transcriptional regulator [Brevibacterium album]|uniref:TetR/AcrR family transcriptional regulator n=1 Tax=Brevibacterium album TaxID=417948 RepID=UPI00040B46F2|nr:TetR/AcrR family transcriptional regulator [Brevibacterium album]
MSTPPKAPRTPGRDTGNRSADAQSNELGLPRAVAIAWGMQEAPQRGPNRGLSHERIVAAAAEIADAEGLGAVTMQAVARALGFTTMSLYRYVSGKDELLRLLQDYAFRLPEKGVALPADWREALRAWASLLRERHRAHPWGLQIPRGQVSVLMPSSVRAADLGLQALAGLRADEEEKVAAILMVSQFVASVVELELNLADEGVLAVTAEGVDALAEAITPARFPHLGPLMAAGRFIPLAPAEEDDGDQVSEETGDMDAEFEFGLGVIIAGLEDLQRGDDQEE